jgi:hypothetical protein
MVNETKHYLTYRFITILLLYRFNFLKFGACLQHLTLPLNKQLTFAIATITSAAKVVTQRTQAILGPQIFGAATIVLVASSVPIAVATHPLPAVAPLPAHSQAVVVFVSP